MLSELNILLAALIIIFPTLNLQISTKSTAQFLGNSCLKMEFKNKFPIWKILISSIAGDFFTFQQDNAPAH